MGLDKDEDKKKEKNSSVSGREATSFPDLRVVPAPRAWGLHNQMWTLNSPQQGWSLPGKNLLSGPVSSVMWCCSMFPMTPSGKELLGLGGLLNHRCLRVRMTQGLTTLRIIYIKKIWQNYRWGQGCEEGLTTSESFSRNISTPAQQSSLKENIMEKQAMGISLHCWTQGPKSQSTNIVLHIQTPRGRNTDLA